MFQHSLLSYQKWQNTETRSGWRGSLYLLQFNYPMPIHYDTIIDTLNNKSHLLSLYRSLSMLHFIADFFKHKYRLSLFLSVWIITSLLNKNISICYGHLRNSSLRLQAWISVDINRLHSKHCSSFRARQVEL